MKKLCLFFVLLVSCSNVKNTIRENRQTLVNLEIATGITTGVLVEKHDTLYVILTVAHLCEPTSLIDDDGIVWMADIDTSIEDGSFCRPTVKFTGNDNREVATLTAINFEEDLALFVVSTEICYPIVTFSGTNNIHYGQAIYSITAMLEFDYPLMAWGKISGLIRERTTGQGVRPRRTYFQTQFMMGAGSSGSPVFNMDNELIGLHSVELVTPTFPNTRFSFSQPVWIIRKFMIEANEHNITWNQRDEFFKPFCKGTKFQCAVINGTGRLLEEFLKE